MKNLLYTLLLIISMASSSYAVNSPKPNPNNSDVIGFELIKQNQKYPLEIQKFLEFTPKVVAEQTGEKLSLKEVIGLKIAQHQIKQAYQSAQRNKPQKSQIAALLFAYFLGVIGAHRFYLGYPIIGIVQILTLGGCGIWVLIDLILIATGELGPKDGSGYKSW